MKTCGDCNQSKSESEFNKKGKDRLQSRCRECQKIWYKNYYKTSPKEKARIYESNRQIFLTKQKIIKDAKDVPCADCGIKYPSYVMDFDHQRDKAFTIARTSNATIQQIREEIQKCEVVCANCHRERTWGRLTT